MGDNNSSKKSRRSFLSLGFSKPEAQAEKVKMLTADGKLVEVDKSVLKAIDKNQKASNREILEWMKNPSKDQ
jgi:hypothetical protein